MFVDRFLEKNISGTDDREETTKRRQLSGKASKWTVLLMSAAIHIKGDGNTEEILRIADTDRERLFAAHEKRNRTGKEGIPGANQIGQEFDVNVIGVRTRKSKAGRLHRSRTHEEFIIRTRQPSGKAIHVSRRYGDFIRLADTLRLEFPEEEIPRPPAKDRRETDVKSPLHTAESSLSDGAMSEEVVPQIGRLAMEDVASDGSASHQYALRSPNMNSGVSPSPSSQDLPASSRSSTDSPQIMPQGPLARERNRLTLRAYVRALLANAHVAESEAMSSFLLSEPIFLTASEESDAQAREALDAVRDDEAQRFSEEANRRVAALREHLQSFKSDLIQRDGLTRVFSTIKSTPNIDGLPESYRALIAWGRISLASTLFHLFVGSDTSSDLFGQLKRIHGLMPYFMLRGILRISNPVSMIRGVLDLFLAQPFGQKSLLQRMLTSNIQEEARDLGEMANRIADKVEDDALCERVRCFVYAPLDLQTEIRAEAERDRLDLMTVILKSDHIPPYDSAQPPPVPLNRSQVHRVVRSSRAFELYKEYRSNLGRNEVDEGPDAVDSQAWLYEDLHVLLKCLTRLRDKEQLISLLFEGVTSELLKDIVTIFYSPLAQVYKAANIADSLSDLQTFVNDLIRTVESNEELSYTDPQKTVQSFIDLVARHEAHFYAFVHQVHSKGSGLFDGLMHWIELFINFVRGPDRDDASVTDQATQRRGIGEVDLEVCLPAVGQERQRVLQEIDRVVVYAYRLKLMRELKLKRRLADSEVRGAARRAGISDPTGGGLEDDDETAFVSAMAENLGVGDAFTDEVHEVEAEEEAEEAAAQDEDDDDTDTDTYTSFESASSEGDSDPTQKSHSTEQHSDLGRWKPPMPVRSISTLTAQAADKKLPPLPVEEVKRKTRHGRRRQLPKTPTLVAIPEMLPLFVEMIRPLLRPARTASATSHLSLHSPTGTQSNTAPFALSSPPSRTQSPRLPRRSASELDNTRHTDRGSTGGWFG